MTLDLQQPHRAAASGAATWRLLWDGSLPGALNMAIDEMLLDSMGQTKQPVVRFYTWSRPTLSIGVNQPLSEIDREECTARGFDVVRRLTGGRAVLHQHELTYSVIAPENEPRVAGGVVEAYRKISAALVRGLESLGTEVELAESTRRAVRGRSAGSELVQGDDESAAEAVCFSASSAYELSVGGRKLVGSAQARRGGALLQHGSILLDIDWDAWVSVFRYASDRGRDASRMLLPMRMTSLGEHLGRVPAPDEVASRLKVAFEEALGVRLDVGDLSTSEMLAVRALAESKYGSDEWTARK